MSKKDSAAPRDLIRSLLMHGGLKVTHRRIQAMGFYATETTIERERLAMVEDGVREAILRPTAKGGERGGPPDPEQDARIGSEKLLRAQLRAGQHFITDRVRFREACASVGLAA